ncbi:hypothetical protein FQR65_LT00014 [Abscondita terminalis]|nr:hypothetical protein FQR65_LT00014 [Abscondita terminalis]
MLALGVPYSSAVGARGPPREVLADPVPNHNRTTQSNNSNYIGQPDPVPNYIWTTPSDTNYKAGQRNPAPVYN